MPGLYALGTQPFYLQRDPVTGAVDFSIPSQGGNSNHRYSSKVITIYYFLRINFMIMTMMQNIFSKN
jgi:hypothetical protein